MPLIPALERNIRLEETGGQGLCLPSRGGQDHLGRGKSSLVVGCFAFLIFSPNPNICLWVFIICAALLPVLYFLLSTSSSTVSPESRRVRGKVGKDVSFRAEHSIFLTTGTGHTSVH